MNVGTGVCVTVGGVLGIAVGALVGYGEIDGAKHGRGVGALEGIAFDGTALGLRVGGMECTGGDVGLAVGLTVGAVLNPFTFPKERKVSCIFL
jgi:hypothetical protein